MPASISAASPADASVTPARAVAQLTGSLVNAARLAAQHAPSPVLGVHGNLIDTYAAAGSARFVATTVDTVQAFA
jgi:hypothetical protein